MSYNEINIFFRFGFSRVTNERTAEMRDLLYIKLVDLDNSCCNRIVHEQSANIDSFVCPHHIIVGVIKIVGEFIRQVREGEESAALKKSVDTEKLLEEHKKALMKELLALKSDINEIKSKI